MKLSDLKAGDVVYTDAGFTCLDAGQHVVQSDDGGLFIPCDEGHHYLCGQENEDGSLSGVNDKPFPPELITEKRQRI